MRRVAVSLVLAVLLAGCAVAVPETPGRRETALPALPPMKTFAPARAAPPTRSNAGIARDLLELEFTMESGRPLPVLTRFEGPVTVALTGAVPATAPADLAALLGRLRAEAGIGIRAVAAPPAAITVEFLPRAKMQALVPQAACFVVPGVSSWAAYRAARRSDRVDWTTLTLRTRAAVFVPSDTAPQEVRDCLHEEIAQALGPLDDLYRLSDSVFNDDNFHTVLTGFDMLALRVHYAPELASGMTRAEVAARLPALLARLNPAGAHAGPSAATPTPRAWITAVETALGPQGEMPARRAAAAAALAIAEGAGWQDARLGFSYFAVGRLSMADDMAGAMAAMGAADRIYRRLPDAAIHRAHVEMQMAAYALSAGRPGEAVRLVDGAVPAARTAGNAALLASLLMIKAEALEMTGHPAAARALRLDSLGWARYGFGADDVVRAHLSEIAVPPPAPRG